MTFNLQESALAGVHSLETIAKAPCISLISQVLTPGYNLTIAFWNNVIVKEVSPMHKLAPQVTSHDVCLHTRQREGLESRFFISSLCITAEPGS